MANATFRQTLLKENFNQIDLVKSHHSIHSDADFSFDLMIKQHPNVPDGIAILGKAGKMPILFDLSDPRPGSILVVNDHLPSIRKFFTVIMRSIIEFSHSSGVQFITISHYPDKWMDTIQGFDPQFVFSAGVSGENEKSAEDWIFYLAKKAEDRRSGKNNGPAAILFLDDWNLINNFDIKTKLNFEWLVKYGASARIWVISGLDVSKENEIHPNLNLFKTKIFGYIDQKRQVINQIDIPMEMIRDLAPERNFLTKIGANWIRFWAPKLQG